MPVSSEVAKMFALPFTRFFMTSFQKVQGYNMIMRLLETSMKQNNIHLFHSGQDFFHGATPAQSSCTPLILLAEPASKVICVQYLSFTTCRNICSLLSISIAPFQLIQGRPLQKTYWAVCTTVSHIKQRQIWILFINDASSVDENLQKQ